MTLRYPAPDTSDDLPRVYVSVGHQQMMTDAMRPLGLSLWQLVALRPMVAAGGRLFVDVTAALAQPATRAAYLDALGASDPLVRDALQTAIDRGEVLTSEAASAAPDGTVAPAGVQPAGATPPALPTNPAIVAELVERSRASLGALEHRIAGETGAALFEFVLADLAELKALLADPASMPSIMAGFEAAAWLNRHVEHWLGDTGSADVLALSAPGNVTSEMGLALLDTADAIRPHAAAVAELGQLASDDAHVNLEALAAVDGGREALGAIEAFLSRYGMRCTGEIDVTRPRWRERPADLLAVLLANVRNFPPGEAARRFEAGRRTSEAAACGLLARLRELPDGEAKAVETEQMIERLRTFVGYREYPKFVIVCRLDAYRQALLREADRLVETGAIDTRDDVYFLTFHEFAEAARTGLVDRTLLAQRRDEFHSHELLAPPRVLLSTGEGLDGSYHRETGTVGRLSGLGVSRGTVEGRARVVRDLGDAWLEPGDILVTAHTDPSWTPAFVGIAGLVTEVGGLLTHGAVVAREYGLPAVVGVARATELIADGATIRIDGTSGDVELL